ncbi:MAG: hypothetical protein P1U85_04700 [Verrucomicrobiales bacterium]|nr:hypothetical protein [Verrucomicrobiales bacterium]
MRRRKWIDRGRVCILLMALTGAFLEVGSAQSFSGDVDWEEKVANYLDAERLLDLDLEQRELEPYFFTLLDQAWEKDREKIAPLVLHTEKLIRFEQREGEGWFRSMWNGWSVLAEILNRYNKTVPGIRGIGIYSRVFRADEGAVFPTGGGFLHHNNRDLFRIFQASGGNYDVAQAMDRVSTRLRSVCGEGTMIFLLPTLSHFPSYLRPEQERQMAMWAAEVLSEEREGDEELARWVDFGCRLHRREERATSGPGSLPPKEVVRLEKELIAILEDEALSHAWRQGFAARVSATMPERLGTDVRLAIGRVSGETFQEDIAFSSIGMSRCLWAFLRVEKETEDWKAVAEELEKGWRHRNRFNGESKSKGLALDPSRLTVIGMMEIACRLKDGDSADWHLQSFTETYGAFPGMFVSLVGAGFHERAERLLRRKAAEVRFRSDHYLVGPRYSWRLHEQIPDFLDSVKAGDWRDYAGLLLAATLDPEPEFGLDPVLPLRSQRIATAAKSLEFSSIRDKELRVVAEDILSTMRGGDSLSGILKKPTSDFFQHFEDAESLCSTDLYWLSHQHFYEAMVQLTKGESFPAQFTWGRIVFEEHENSRDLQRHGAEAVVDMTQLWLEDLILQRDLEKVKSLLPFGRQVMGTVPVRVYRTDVSNLQNTLLIAHLFCDEIELYREWWTALPEERQEFLGEMLYDEMGLVGRTGKLLNGRKEAAEDRFPDEEQRRAQFLGLISNPLVNAGYTRNGVLGYGFSRELVTEEDLVAVAETAAREAPREGVAIREWLGLIADLADPEASLAKVEEMASSPEWRERSEVVKVVVKIERALLLDAVGRKDEAKTQVDKLSELPIELSSDLNSYLGEVEKRFQDEP